MTRSKPPFEGSCLCGSVTVQLSAPPLLTVACHCQDCQKLCASAFSLTTMFPADAFSCSGDHILGGLRSKGREHNFCKSCLNFVFSRIEGADYRVNLRTSVLDDAALFDPFIEVMTEEKLPWATVSAEHSYTKFPQTSEELQALMDAYSAREFPG